MGWLKRIFRSDSGADEETGVVLEETVEISKLPVWIEERSDRVFLRVKPEIEKQFKIIMDEKHTLLSNLEDLREAELQNPNIPEREKSIMEGNRASYISQHKQFLNMIETSNALTCKEVSLFCKNFDELLERLAATTVKGHLVMSEFFSNFTSKINKNVKIMKDAADRIESILGESNLNIESIDDIRKSVAELNSKIKVIAEIGEELGLHEKKLANSRTLRAKLEKSIDALKKQDSFAEFQEADNERNKSWKELKRIEEEIGSLFSPLDRPMRKFERMLLEDTKLFCRYIENPVTAVIDDDGLEILSLMEKMKSAISEGKIELKDKEAEKASQKLNQMTKELLTELRTRHAEIKKTIKHIDDEMRNNTVMQDLNDIQYKIEHADSQIKLLADKIDNAKKTRDRIDLELLKGELKEKIKQAFMIEVNIKWQDSQQAS